MIRSRKAHLTFNRKRRTPIVALPEKVESCILITPDGTVATYRLSGLDASKKKALWETADKIETFIHAL